MKFTAIQFHLYNDEYINISSDQIIFFDIGNLSLDYMCDKEKQVIIVQRCEFARIVLPNKTLNIIINNGNKLIDRLKVFDMREISIYYEDGYLEDIILPLGGEETYNSRMSIFEDEKGATLFFS